MTDSTERLATALEGRYRVLRRVGEGGMALVYLAEDLKHGRQVALKILRPELAQALGPERFLREIAIAARLTHPNILPLLDSGDAAGTLFYVMPYVAGESLRDRLGREGQLPVDEAVKIAQRVALALGYAHGLGVVHRDIKPENILLAGGEPVVTDFGIAKAVSAAGQTKLTETGFAVGTAAYMSPEQASAEAQVDGRSDVYALGCVLYEMLAGAVPYPGPTVHAITARKLTEPVPPLRTVRDTVPMAVEQIVFKALAKLPADRYGTAGQMADALEAARGSVAAPPGTMFVTGSPPTGAPAYVTPTGGAPAGATATGAAALLGRGRRALPWAVAFVAVAAAAVLPLRGRGGAGPDSRLSVTLPRGTEIYGWGPPVVLSPDGSTLVFVAGRNDSTKLYVRRLDSFETRALPGSEGGDSPFFSPDGRWVGFFARKERQLRKVALSGGSPVTVAEDLGIGAAFAVWGPRDTIYFGNWPDIQIRTVAASGGAIGTLTHGNPPNGWFRYPLFLSPDGRDLVVAVNGGGPRLAHVDAVSLRTGEHRLLVDGAGDARLVDDRYLVYVPWDRPEVRALRFDAGRPSASGDGVVVLDSVAIYPNQSPFFLATSPKGVVAYVPLGRWVDPNAWGDMVIVGRDGRAQPRQLPQGDGPRFSPDGHQLVYVGQGRHDPDVLVYDLVRGIERHLTGEGSELWPIFTPDGRSVVFNSSNGRPAGTLLLYSAPVDGSGRALRLPTDTLNHQQPFGWAADGTEIVYTEGPQAAGDMDIWAAPLSGKASPRPLMHTPANETQPAVSPDGRWLAWMTDASGRREVMVRRYPDGPDVRVSREGGVEPAWGPGGREIYFRDIAGTKMMVAPFQPGEPPRIGAPRVLFSGRYATCNTWCRSYDVNHDGRIFVMLRVPEGFTETGYWAVGGEIRVVSHFEREVAAKLRAAQR